MSDEPAPKSTLPYPPLHKDKKFVVLSDWDGTITTFDSNDYMTDNLGFGKDLRRQGNLDILSGKVTFRDAFRDMLQSVVDNGHGYEECKRVLRENIVLDHGFKTFHTFCVEHDIPIIIVSSGMEPTIRATIDIISNDVEILSPPEDKEAMQWGIKFRHPTSGFGHDKSQAILPYRKLAEEQGGWPKVLFFGDGVSDMSAAKHADYLFVKTKSQGENDLVAYCRREGIEHTVFTDFEAVVPLVEKIMNENVD
ncbi:hypothetical protein BDZ89DRAFT_1169707 [Hymenopellis radicata]|nr:hypothetical protein BDZ89DRAFT_1169707 [Hymenopellis radicata]